MTESRRTFVRMTLLALSGLVVAVGLGLATTNITSQTVGLSAEEASVSDELVVDRQTERRLERDRRAKRRANERGAADSKTTTAPSTPTMPEPAGGPTGSDDEDGPGGGSGSDESSGGEDSDSDD